MTSSTGVRRGGRPVTLGGTYNPNIIFLPPLSEVQAGGKEEDGGAGLRMLLQQARSARL